MTEDLDLYDYACEDPRMGAQRNEMVKLHGQELICCPRCDKPKLEMDTIDIRQGLIVGKDGSGIFADYHCRNCSETFTLAVFNQPLQENGDMAARINWVYKT